MPTTPGTGLRVPTTTTRTTATLSFPSSRIVSKEHVTIEDMFDAYRNCRRHKRCKDSAIEFELNYELNCYALYQQLNSQAYQPGTSVTFCVTRPKLREVFAAMFRDRVVHTLLMMRTEAAVECRLTDCACACRKGKGTHYAVRRLKDMLMMAPDGWTVKCDISGFFMAIDKRVLLPLWEDVVREACPDDTDWWLWLTRTVIMHRPEHDCEMHGNRNLWKRLPDNKTLFRTNGLGMPIGNLPSQISANLYLAEFDRQMTVWLGGEMRYVRYADDFVMVHPDRHVLLRVLSQAREWLREHRRLELHPKKVTIQPVSRGVNFLGSFVRGGIVTPGKRLRGNALRVADEWAMAGTHTDEERLRVCRQWNSYAGLLRQYDSYRIRRSMWRRMGDYEGLNCINMNKIVLTNKNKNHYETVC